ncbi:hypothetical protein RvY_05581 [Ramazzottius varieornatus]|uniref:Uncharacterized protein n=1 Tax=Ramazzottius varieornatus TaxID=947166 RepID=A0A1D1V4J6_RAMVA|nr:hypothetical protein RvY_05581 [Ramazzottius varieornatus]
MEETGVHGKIILVTGASSGIGAATCRLLASNGATVIGAARREDRLRDLEHEINALNRGKFHGIKCDLTREQDIEDMFREVEERYHRLDCLMANAGVPLQGALLNNHTKDLQHMMQVNILATAICIREGARLMQKVSPSSGHIVIVGSDNAHKIPAAPLMHFYAATKCAVLALAQGLRLELVGIESKIRVTHLSPGPVRTEASSSMFPNMKDPQAELFANYTPLESDDIANAILYAILAPPNVNVNEIVVNPIQGDSIPRPKHLSG